MSARLKDKIILVTYFPIDGMDNCDVFNYLEEVTKSFKTLIDDSVECIVVPTRQNGDYRVECINPVLLNEEKYAEVEETVNKFKMKVNELFKEKEENGKTSD